MNQIDALDLVKNKNSKEKTLLIFLEALIDGTNEKVIKIVFPEIYEQKGFGIGKFHKWDVYDHSRNTIMNYFSMEILPKNIKEYLKTEIEGISRESLLLIAMAFHDSGKKSCYNITGKFAGHAEYTIDNQFDDIASRLSLTEKQKQFVGNIIKYHDYLPENCENFKKYFIEEGFFAEFLIISYCDLFATLGPKCTKEEFNKRQEVVSHELNNFSLDNE